MNVKLRVERVEFDSETCTMRINGRNVEENEFIKVYKFYLYFDN